MILLLFALMRDFSLNPNSKRAYKVTGCHVIHSLENKNTMDVSLAPRTFHAKVSGSAKPVRSNLSYCHCR